MTVKVNTSWKHKIFMLSLISLISAALVFSVIEKRDSSVNGIKIDFKKNYGKSLISKQEVQSKLSEAIGFDVAAAQIKELPIHKFEALLEKDTRIHESEIYLNAINQMVIRIELSEPIVRVNPKNGKGFYLDQYGNRINLSKRVTVRVPVATGLINGYTSDFMTAQQDSSLYQVFDLARRLYNDPQFLSPLVEQINVDKNNDLTLVPKVGREKIFFGKFENVDDKFYRLSEFYRRGLPNEGWNKYKVLRLDIKDQVIGSKEL
jgi:cell division protein FtsQ